MEEKQKTLTGVEVKWVNKHLEILKRRLSYLDERYMLRQNSFDGAECAALRHVIWLLTLEINGDIVLTHEKAREAHRGGDSKLASDKRILRVEEPDTPSRIILRKANKGEGQI